MKFFFCPEQQAHAPAQFILRGQFAESPEQPVRAELMQDAITAMGETISLVTLEADHSLLQKRLKRIHTTRYLQFLETVVTQWRALPQASTIVMPNVHPYGATRQYPRHVVGRAGWHFYDMACPLVEGSYSGIMASALTAQTAAEAVLQGEAGSYALCRPPGHHAGPERTGGFCFINNAALAATVLRERFSRVAVVDVDVHHGNGTQEIFWERSDIWTGSIHADPADYYPFYWGAANETGHGEGAGYNCNIPLPVGTGGDDFLRGLSRLISAMDRFRPEAIVIALGLDAHKDDPLAGMTLETGDFNRIGQCLARLQGPKVIIQEGGYPTDSLGANLAAFLRGFSQG